jgi:hypothetical protein
LHSFRYTLRSGIAGSYGRSMFSFLRSLHIVFQNGCIAYIPTKQCMRVLFSLHPRQHLLLLVFLMIAILTEVKRNLSVVLICISFMAGMMSIFSCVFWPFGFLPLKKFCLIQLLTSL